MTMRTIQKQLLRYSLISWDHIRYNIPRFISNFWFFKGELYKFRSWDWRDNLLLFKKSLEATLYTIEKYGSEMEINKGKKVNAMKRLIYVIDVVGNEEYLSLAEKELNSKYVHQKLKFKKTDNPNFVEWVNTLSEEEQVQNSILIKKAKKIEHSFWNEMFRIMKGQTNTQEINTQEINTKNEGGTYIQSNNDEKNLYSIEPVYDDTTSNGDFDGTGLKNWWD